MGADPPSALAGCVAEGVTVVTASAHLARSIQQGYDAAQIAAGHRVWPEARIFTWTGWLAALCAALPDGGQPPYLATAGQEDALWRQVIASAGGAGDTRALASAAAGAWRLSQEWRIRPDAMTAETAAFAAWASALRRELSRRQWLTEAELPDWVRGQLGRGLPNDHGSVLPLGFQPPTGQQWEFFAAWRAAGGEVLAPPSAGAPGERWQARFTGEAEEAEAAAAWTRRELEAGAKRLGIVALDLARRREQLQRALMLALALESWLPGGGGHEATIHLTLGQALSEFPVIRAALRILRALAPDAGHAAEFSPPEAEALVMSPYLEGAGPERTARGRVAIELSKTRQLALGLGGMLRAAERAGAPQLATRLRAARRLADGWPRGWPPPVWAEAFAAALKAAGWPGAGLGSEEFQAADKWRELLEAFARQGTVLAELTAGEALAELEALAAARTFQPEAGAAAVTLLSPEASASEQFDAIWVLGAEAAAWPPPARLNPWLPAAAQRAARLPWATPDGARQWAEEVFSRLAASTPRLIASYAPQANADVATASPLIVGWAPYAAGADRQWPRDLPLAEREAIPDTWVAEAVPAEVRGGAMVFTDQSRCPFRAFARHRLGAEEFDPAAAGLDAMARGELLHDVLHRIFDDLAGSGVVVAIPPREECEARARAAAEAAVAAAQAKPVMAALRSPTFAALETNRLANTAAHWLCEVEGQRDKNFAVLWAEEKAAGEIGGLRFRWRADRVDRIGDSGTVIVDFKSGGQHGPGDWKGERPWDLQLPLYAVLAEPPPLGVAFALLKPGEMAFSGWAAADQLLPGCKRPEGTSWPEQVASWRGISERLAADYLAGLAAVKPLPKACESCGLQVLCRVGEEGSMEDAAEPGDGGE